MTTTKAANRKPRILGPLDASAKPAVMEAIQSVEITGTDAWNKLSSLSANTQVEDIQAVPEGLFGTEQKGFRAAATIYVTLNYGSAADAFTSTDSFPAEAQGHFGPDGRAIIDTFTVDTSSFYE